MQNNTQNTTNWLDLSVEDVVAQYRDGDAKFKGGLRSTLTKIGQQAVRDLNMESAVAAQVRLDAIKVTPTSERAEVNWTEVLATRLATMRLATEFYAQVAVPEDVEIDWDEVEALSATVEIDADFLTSLLSQPKTGQRAAKGSISAFLQGAVTDEFQKVSQLGKHIVPEYNSDHGAGAGAISYALNQMLAGKREIEGVEAGYDSDGNLGAVAV